MIPEAQHTITSILQITFTLLIVFPLLQVLPTIELDDQPALGADEIDDVRTNGFLPFELQTEETMPTQVVPEPLLGIGHLATQAFGVVE